MSTLEQRIVNDALAFSSESRDTMRTARSREEKDMIHKYTIEQAFKGLFYGTLGGVGIHMLLTRTVPRYAAWHHTPKWIFTIIWPIAGFSIMGEQSALELERKLAARKSIVDLSTLQQPTTSADPDTLSRFSWVPSGTDLKKYVLDNRYKVVGMSWLTVTSLTLASLWANKNIPVSQKLIHARMYAQGTALASFIAFAFASTAPQDRTSDMDKISERYFNAVREGRDTGGSQYRHDHPAHAVHKIGGEGDVVVRGG